jgi:hypothetical protein
LCIGGDAFLEFVDELNRNKSFEEGAKWIVIKDNESKN